MNFFKSFLNTNNSTNASAAEAKARIESTEPLFILDVRQPEEFRTGHISGAKLIPLNELGKRMQELPADTEILCVCASGSRSGLAARQLSGAGYKTINLRGGMAAWQYAGYTIKKGK